MEETAYEAQNLVHPGSQSLQSSAEESELTHTTARDIPRPPQLNALRASSSGTGSIDSPVSPDADTAFDKGTPIDATFPSDVHAPGTATSPDPTHARMLTPSFDEDDIVTSTPTVPEGAAIPSPGIPAAAAAAAAASPAPAAAPVATPAKAAGAPAPSATPPGAAGLAESLGHPHISVKSPDTTPKNRKVAPAGVQLQLVDEHQAFSAHADAAIKSWNLKGLDYDLVAVFGSQSTGKSTLLNRIFGTGFAVMNERLGRQQTTRGIWASRATNADVLVLDVEGTDGRERGEDQDFERKAALFSMAVAEVLIINVWESQIGLYQGANLGLLKTVLDVHLGLFIAPSKQVKKVKLLFVIRDHIGTTPLATLQELILQDISKIWEGISKPEGYESSSPDMFFDFDFAALPHKVLQADLFEQQCAVLADTFTNPVNPNYVFSKGLHKGIPVDGLPRYLETIWDAVQSNKDLDLPTQQELLSQFRCDALAADAFNQFQSTIDSHGKDTFAPDADLSVLEAAPIGASWASAVATAVTAFDSDASRYNPSVYKRVRSDLMEKMHKALQPIFVTYVAHIARSALATFVKDISNPNAPHPFSKTVENARSDAIARYKHLAETASLDGIFPYDLDHFSADLDAAASAKRAEQSTKFAKSLHKVLAKDLDDPIEHTMANPSPSMWDTVLDIYEAAVAHVESIYRMKAPALLGSTPEEDDAAVASLKSHAWDIALHKIRSLTTDAHLLMRLKALFEDRFRYDAAGLPRVWSPADDIDSIFNSAKSAVIDFIPAYAAISPSEPSRIPPAATEDEENPLILVSSTRVDAITKRFVRDADAYFVDTKRSIVSSSAHIPPWVYVALIVLGWNEILAILRNPLLVLLLLVVLPVLYFAHRTGTLEPAIKVGHAALKEMLHSAYEQAHLYFENANRPELVPEQELAHR